MLFRSICLHTNLDCVDGGVNDELCRTLNIMSTSILEPLGKDASSNDFGIGRIGNLEAPLPFEQFIMQLKSTLAVNAVRYHYAGREVSRVAVCGGSGASSLEHAVAAGCDTFVTADVKYDRFLAAKEYGINLIDADHFCTENVVIPVLENMLKSDFPDLEVVVSKTPYQIAQVFYNSKQ